MLNILGLDSNSVEDETLLQSKLRNMQSNPKVSAVSSNVDQASSGSSGREKKRELIGGKPKACPISQCASKGSVHRHIRYNAFFV